jgi:hypothetical protein
MIFKTVLRNCAVSLTALSIVGCLGSSTPDYAGRYMLRIGNDCLPDEKSANPNELFVEITKLGDQDIYQARMPPLAQQNMPSVSEQTSPLDDQLSFVFLKEGKPGLFRGEPAIEVSLAIVRHENSERHVVVTELKGTVSQNGNSQNIDLLEMMQSQYEDGFYSRNGIQGFCMEKQSIKKV